MFAVYENREPGSFERDPVSLYIRPYIGIPARLAFRQWTLRYIKDVNLLVQNAQKIIKG